MKSLARTLATLALAAGAFVVVPPARAQIDPYRVSIGVFQNRVLVGEVLRTDLDPEHYVEHWVLYPGYVYPSAENRVVTELRPGLRAYDSVEDFFRRVPFEKGSRYVKVDCTDGTTLPGR